MKKALDGLKILDFSRVLAGPFCTMILADLGAEVIKVERPDTGDDSRLFGPFMGKESAYFMSINRNKKSISLDLKNPEAIAIVKEMVKSVDILVENFRPGVMDKLGIGWKDLKDMNPRLIYASSSGFGQTGPYSQLPAYDLIIQGMGGIMSITGPDSKTPTKVGSSIADIFAGVYTAIGILTALHHREKTGEGQMVDVSMLDCQVAILENAIARYFVKGEIPCPIGNRHPSITPFATLSTSDGLVNIAVGNDAIWKRYCEELGAPELADDARFSTNELRTRNWHTLEGIIEDLMITRNTSDWIERFSKSGIPCGPINHIDGLLHDPQVAAREMIIETPHPKAGNVKMSACPIKLSETPVNEYTHAPMLGEHTVDILKNYLNMSDEQISSLREKGVI